MLSKYRQKRSYFMFIIMDGIQGNHDYHVLYTREKGEWVGRDE